MTGLGQGSAIAAYQQQVNSMQRSHDENGSIQMNMYSLGVMDLDWSISPDVFGLRAFDEEQPVKRMLPGSSPCELRLMLPDDKLGIDGFHDVIIENLSATPVTPADITSLRHVALPCHMVRGMEGVGACLFGASGGKTWGFEAGDHDERCKVFFPMDCDSGRLAHCPPSGRIRLFHEAGRRLVFF